MKRIILLLGAALSLGGCTALPEKTEPVPHSGGPSLPVQGQAPREILFAPTYSSSEADKYFDALEIYESSPQASQGVFRHEGLVFVIVCIDTNKEKIKYLEGTAMLRTAAMLREKYPGLPPRFHVRNRVVEKRLDDDTGIYRYATVYREKDIERKAAALGSAAAKP